MRNGLSNVLRDLDSSGYTRVDDWIFANTHRECVTAVSAMPVCVSHSNTTGLSAVGLFNGALEALSVSHTLVTPSETQLLNYV